MILKEKIIKIIYKEVKDLAETQGYNCEKLADQILSEVEKVFEGCLPEEANIKSKEFQGINFGFNKCREQTKTNFKKLL